MTKVINAPDQIWLNYGDDIGEEIDHVACFDVSWTDQFPTTDCNVRYVRAALNEASLEIEKSCSRNYERKFHAVSNECAELQDSLNIANGKLVNAELQLAALQSDNDALVTLTKNMLVNAEARNAEMAALQAENDRLRGMVPRWVPVSERLPESFGDYLVSRRCNPRGHRATWAPVGWCGAYHEYPEYPITHWMPLPPPAPVNNSEKER